VPPVYAHDPFLAVQHALAARWLDGPMLLATRACEGWVLIAVGIAWARIVDGRTRGRSLRLAALLGVALVLDGAAVDALKHALHLPRPLAVLGPGAVHVVAEPLRQYSFPSGHSSAAAALAVAAALARGARRAAPLLVLAAVGGISRVYVGAHWTIDVAAGWALGAVLALAVHGAAAAVRLRGGEALPGQAAADVER